MALTSRTADHFEAALSAEGAPGAVSDDLGPLLTVRVTSHVARPRLRCVGKGYRVPADFV